MQLEQTESGALDAFTGVPPEKPNFPSEEERVFAYWKKIDAFEQQLKRTKDCKKFTFFDGPPFATGLPHYGHICAGTIKDVVTRYAAQTGHYVERRFGWDCHGLPIEHEIDKLLNIKTKAEVLKMGVPAYNKECKGIVMRYSSEWRKSVERLGRWIDFDNDYKTMDLSFMESVWWVFKQIWSKGLVYRGVKVMPYSNACNTVLSNFEAASNFKDTVDPSVYITFPLQSDPKLNFLAWTTTPWTLLSNMALMVNPTMKYVEIVESDTKRRFILAECRLDEVFGKGKQGFTIIRSMMGKELEGMEYMPLFDFFADRAKDGCFRVLCADFVSSDAGTGVVHAAPAFGEDDFRICTEYKIVNAQNIVCPIDDNGHFLQSVGKFSGLYVKDADKEVLRTLKEKGRLYRDGQITHSYPYCWRSDTPLIYKAVSSWFIKVTDLKSDLIANNKKARWVPPSIQENRFNNWLADAKDWCFSRNRFWGNPIPLWVSDDFEEVVCVGSIAELKELTGVTEVTDLHREHIDHLTIPSKTGRGVLRRVEEVFDCWFESGAMPFAQVHYPFSMNEEEFKAQFPADFIGEGIDQTRGWFYTLNVLATAVYNDTPYKNLIVNGIVLAADGKKMSKRLKNYPDPNEVVSKYGADAVRLYLMNSPLVKAETLNFAEKGLAEVTRRVFLPWYNVYRFLIQNITRWERQHSSNFVCNLHDAKSDNILDHWILAANSSLIKFARNEMDNYRLYTVVPRLLQYLEDLTNWYVRLNRARLKGEGLQKEDWALALKVLFKCLLNHTILMAPFVPFLTETIYQNLRSYIPKESEVNQDSIHFVMMPNASDSIDEEIEGTVRSMKSFIEIGRLLREKEELPLKQPLQCGSILSSDPAELIRLKPLLPYIEEELNLLGLNLEADANQFRSLEVVPNHKVLGQRLKSLYTSDLKKALSDLSPEQKRQIFVEKKIIINSIELQDTDFVVKQLYESASLGSDQRILGDSYGRGIILNTRVDDSLALKRMAREIGNRIQKLKKQAGVNPDDNIAVYLDLAEGGVELPKVFERELPMIQSIVKKPLRTKGSEPSGGRTLIEDVFEFEDLKEKLKVRLLLL